jgi:hypothetical protein
VTAAYWEHNTENMYLKNPQGSALRVFSFLMVFIIRFTRRTCGCGKTASFCRLPHDHPQGLTAVRMRWLSPVSCCSLHSGSSRSWPR